MMASDSNEESFSPGAVDEISRAKKGEQTCCCCPITVSCFVIAQDEVGHFEILVDADGADILNFFPEES